MDSKDVEKYWKLSCNHTAIDQPSSNVFSVPDDYPFMEQIEEMIGLPKSAVGNFRAGFARLGSAVFSGE